MNAEIGRKRVKNEKKFSCWKELEGGGRKYWYRSSENLGLELVMLKKLMEEKKQLNFTRRYTITKAI